MRSRRLIVITPEGERELLFVGRLRVGRAAECDISLADTKASRHHAEFDASGPVPRVTDLGSRNGILVNGHKVTSADLAPGDVVTVGDARIRFVEQVPMTATTPAAAAAAGPVAAPVAAPASAPVAATPVDDRTAVLSGPPAAAPARDAPPPPAAGVPSDPPANQLAHPPARAHTDQSTAVMPPPQAPREDEPAPAAAVGAPDERTMVLLRPPGSAAVAVDEPAPNPVESRPVDARPAESAPPAPAAPVVAAARPLAAAEHAVQPPGTLPAAATVKGPRVSWGGLVTLTAVLLGGLAVLLGALPVLSVASGSVDALSHRQARTLAGWLAAGVDPQSSPVVDAGVLEEVLTQTGVERAVVLDRATGRAVAPASMSGQRFSTLPGIGEGWRAVSDPQVGVNETFVDAYVSAPGGRHVVWVRYQGASSSDAGIAVVVALVASLAFAILGGLMIKRHTRATLQHFTRQVELAVSGSSPKGMQGTLMPGLERLPGVVTYLIEQRKAALTAGAAQVAGRAAVDAVAAAVPVAVSGPPWLEVTTTLEVVERSAHGPASGVAGWASAGGRHLLDVLDDGQVRNTVVQGLGALGMEAGSETTVEAPGLGSVTLRRQQSGHVRVVLGTR